MSLPLPSSTLLAVHLSAGLFYLGDAKSLMKPNDDVLFCLPQLIGTRTYFVCPPASCDDPKNIPYLPLPLAIASLLWTNSVLISPHLLPSTTCVEVDLKILSALASSLICTLIGDVDEWWDVKGGLLKRFRKCKFVFMIAIPREKLRSWVASDFVDVGDTT